MGEELLSGIVDAAGTTGAKGAAIYGLAKALGNPSIGKAIEISTQTIADLTTGTFTRLVYPVAEETGLLMQDIVRILRQNMLAVAQKADALPRPEGSRFNPMVAGRLLEAASYADDELLQNMWAGLLASSCTAEGDDDSNLTHLNLLANMTRNQAKIIDWLAKQVPEDGWKSNPFIIQNGFKVSEYVEVDGKRLSEITGESDLVRLHSELVSLVKSLNLIECQPLGMSNSRSTDSKEEQFGYRIRPSYWCLWFYIRCQGSRLSPAEYFSAKSC
jgi:hypothetical protein